MESAPGESDLRPSLNSKALCYYESASFSSPLALFLAITHVYLQSLIFHFHEDNHDLIGPVCQHDHVGKNLDTKRLVAYLADVPCHKIASTKNNPPTPLFCYYFIKC